ncbi:hypothetical protein BOQ60_26450, partial [Chryseobacterium sp. CH1]
MEDGSERTVLSLPPALAPIKAAILPLMKKDGLGLDRLFLSIFSHCLRDEVLEDGSERTVLSLPP